MLVWCDAGKVWWSSIHCCTSHSSEREKWVLFLSFVWQIIDCHFILQREREKRERKRTKKKEKERIYLRVVGAPVTGEGNNVLFRHIPEIIHSDFHFWRGYFKDSSLLYEKKPWSAITWWYLSFCFNDTEIIFPGVKKDVIWQSVSCSANTAHPDANSLKYSRKQWKGDEHCHSLMPTWVHCEANLDPWLCDSWGDLAPENVGHSCSAIWLQPFSFPRHHRHFWVLLLGCLVTATTLPLPQRTKKKTQFAFWTCCTRMIRELAGPQGWQTSLPPPPRLPSGFIWSQGQ